MRDLPAAQPRAGAHSPVSADRGDRSPVARARLHSWLASRSAELPDACWLTGLLAGVLLLTALPGLVAALAGPPDLVRYGSFWFVRDFSQYLAAMREGATSPSWLVHNHFTAEPHEPIFQYPLYVAIGKLAALLRTDLLTVYAAVEAVGRGALVLGIYQFAALFLPPGRLRRLAVLLALFSLGLASWLVPARLLASAFGRADLLDALPATINVFLEINSFGLLFAAPHLMLGMALTLLLPRLYRAAGAAGVRAPVGLAWGWLLALALAALALALVHPFNLPVVVAALGAHAGWRALRGSAAPVGPATRPTLRPLVPFLAAAAGGAPIALYHFALFQLDPFWSGTYGVQNVMPSPAPWDLPVDFGLVLLLAPLGGYALLRRRAPVGLLLAWALVTLLWFYVPVPYQRRFGFGLQPALAVLAAAGIAWLQARAGPPGALRRRALNAALLALALNTTALVYGALLFGAATNRPSEVYLWTRDEQVAAEWLATASGPDDVVLAATESGNVLAGWISGRVVHGHIVATYRSDEKRALVRRFFAGGSPDELAALARQARATLVFSGPRERALGALRPDELPFLERVYANATVSVYRVSLAPDPSVASPRGAPGGR